MKVQHKISVTLPKGCRLSLKDGAEFWKAEFFVHNEHLTKIPGPCSPYPN
jgi:hypothetical protein